MVFSNVLFSGAVKGDGNNLVSVPCFIIIKYDCKTNAVLTTMVKGSMVDHCI